MLLIEYFLLCTQNWSADGFGYRHVQVLLLLSGLAIAFSLRVNLSVGIVAMTSAENNNGEVSSQISN